MESLNRLAIDLVDEAIDFSGALGIDVHHLSNDGFVLDFGHNADGGIEAGLLLAEISTAGLATVQTRVDNLAGTPFPFVELSTDHPLLALLCSQKAGWRLAVNGFTGIGSGPARLFIRDGPEFEYTDYTEDFDLTTLAVETSELPGEPVAEEIATHAGIPTSGVYLPTAPAASIAGAVAAAARAAEVAMLRLLILGYNPADVLSATATAPVPPVAADESTALGRANDALAYAGDVHLVATTDSDAFRALPFGETPIAGQSFVDVLADVDWRFAEVEDSFAPAQATVNVRGGPTYAVGDSDPSRLVDAWV